MLVRMGPMLSLKTFGLSSNYPARAYRLASSVCPTMGEYECSDFLWYTRVPIAFGKLIVPDDNRAVRREK